jgi:hypothetical protein
LSCPNAGIADINIIPNNTRLIRLNIARSSRFIQRWLIPTRDINGAKACPVTSKIQIDGKAGKVCGHCGEKFCEFTKKRRGRKSENQLLSQPL